MISTLLLLLYGSVVSFFQSERLGEVLIYFIFAIFPTTLCGVSAGYFKAIKQPAKGCLVEYSSVVTVASVFTFIADRFLEISVAEAAICFLASAVFVFLVCLYFMLTAKLKFGNDPKLNLGLLPKIDSQFLGTSMSFFVLSLSGLTQNVVTVLLAGALMDVDSVGLLRMSDRIAILVSFPLIVINAIFPPMFSRLHRDREFVELNRVAEKSARLGLALSTPLLIIVVLFGREILGIFGAEFQNGYFILVVIAFGQWVNAFTGSVGFLLTMTGHDMIMRWLSVSMTIVGILLFCLSTKVAGVHGSSISLSATLVIQNLISAYFVYSKLGINVFNFLNFNSELKQAERTNE